MLPKSESSKLIDLLPHTGPMRLIDSVQEAKDFSATCTSHLDTNKHRLFGFDDHAISTHIGIELIAQAAAIAIIGSTQDGKAIQGKLIQVKRFKAMQTKIPQLGFLTIEARVELPENAQIASVEGSISLEGSPVCHASLTLSLGQ